LREYLDQQRFAKRDIAERYDRENWLHDAYRTVWRRPRYRLRAPDLASPVLNAWRTPLTKHLSENDVPQPIDDPTARTLAEAVAAARESVGDYE
jgi:hypothetical protein